MVLIELTNAAPRGEPLPLFINAARVNAFGPYMATDRGPARAWISVGGGGEDELYQVEQTVETIAAMLRHA